MRRRGRAENGVLTVMCGGDAPVYARAEPVIAAFARAFGAVGITVSTSAEAPAAVAQALAADGPAVIDVRSSLEHISAFTTLSAMAAASSEPRESVV